MATHPVLTFIQDELERRKAKNPRYSIRSFAVMLGMSSSTLSQILKGKRALTFATARSILASLGVDEPTKNNLLLAFDTPANYVAPRQDHRVLSEKELELIAGWQFYAILCALELPGQSFDAAGLGARIGCDEELARTSLDTLVAAGLVREENGRYVPTGETLTTTHNLPNAALIKAHRDYLQKALGALERYRAISDFSGITLTLDSRKLPEASRRIREFRRSLAAYLADGEVDEVYRINIQLFPLKGG